MLLQDIVWKVSTHSSYLSIIRLRIDDFPIVKYIEITETETSLQHNN